MQDGNEKTTKTPGPFRAECRPADGFATRPKTCYAVVFEHWPKDRSVTLRYRLAEAEAIAIYCNAAFRLGQGHVDAPMLLKACERIKPWLDWYRPTENRTEFQGAYDAFIAAFSAAKGVPHAI